MLVLMIFSDLSNILLPNLQWLCIISQSVMQKNWFAVFDFEVKITAWAHMIKT